MTASNATAGTRNDVPPGWTYNPSALSERLPLTALSIVGFLIAVYLTAFQIGLVGNVWEPFFGDGSRRILTSGLARALPFPDAALGAAAYAVEIATSAAGSNDRWRSMPWLVVVFAVTVFGFAAVSIGLAIAQPLFFNALCSLCLISAAISVVLAWRARHEVRATLEQLRRRTAADISLWSALRGVSNEPTVPSIPAGAPRR